MLLSHGLPKLFQFALFSSLALSVLLLDEPPCITTVLCTRSAAPLSRGDTVSSRCNRKRRACSFTFSWSRAAAAVSKQPNEVQHDTPNPLTVVTIRVVVVENLLKFADCPSRDEELKVVVV